MLIINVKHKSRAKVMEHLFLKIITTSDRELMVHPSTVMFYY